MFNKLLNVKFVIVKSILLTDFSDRISRSRRTGYDVEKTEYEMVKRTQKVLNTVNQLLFTCKGLVVASISSREPVVIVLLL